MPYYRRCGNIISNMVLHTRGDAEHVAEVMNRNDADHVYCARPNMLGYEGPDYGVTKYTKNGFGGQDKFVEWLSRDIMAAMCAARPMVEQEIAHQH